jgi:hypothetical protein
MTKTQASMAEGTIPSFGIHKTLDEYWGFKLGIGFK